MKKTYKIYTHVMYTSEAWDTVGYNIYNFWDALYLHHWLEKCTSLLFFFSSSGLC